ncbi:MAG: SusC/RagA family TonB-linked outer membrane protein, partial [Prolixibacteraceae bacterium]
INWLWENTLDYNVNLGKDHTLAILAGYTAQKQSNELKVIQANSFPDDQVQTIGGGIVIGGTNIQEQWSLVSSLARVNYAFKEKYMVTGTMRSDRSSRFGAGHQTGTFPSISLGWRIDDEPFMRKYDFINEFKLRTSYGLTGNFEIPNYGSIGLLSGANYVLSNTIVNGVGRSTLSNDMLSWESKKQLDIGLDYGFFKDRIYGEFDYYRSVTSDLLLNVTIPSSSGFSTALTNIGEVENKGYEFTISTKNLIGKNFQWSTDFNISSNRNKVLKLGPSGDPILSVGSAGDIRHITRIGDPIGSYYGYQVVGIYQTMAQIAAAPVDLLVGTGVNGGARPGDIQFKDVNGDGKITTADRTTVGKYMPDYTYGITNRFKYKNLDLVIFFQGVQGRQILNLTTRHLLNGEANFNSYAEYNNRWISVSQPGNGVIPRADRNSSLHGNNMRPSSFQVEDGSYFRLRNATLGYDVPLNKTSQKLRIYVSGNNLFTMTKYLGFNPEVQQQSTTSITPGEDYGAYPISSTYMIGFNFTF